jgi:hypothetical protein
MEPTGRREAPPDDRLHDIRGRSRVSLALNARYPSHAAGASADARSPDVIRSLLYVPASSERFIARAHERGADAIILDLEDAVVPAEKAAARARLAAAVPSAAPRCSFASIRRPS